MVAGVCDAHLLLQHAVQLVGAHELVRHHYFPILFGRVARLRFEDVVLVGVLLPKAPLRALLLHQYLAILQLRLLQLGPHPRALGGRTVRIGDEV